MSLPRSDKNPPKERSATYGSWLQAAIHDFCVRYGVTADQIDFYYATHSFPNTSGVRGGLGGAAMTSQAIAIIYHGNNASIYADGVLAADIDRGHVKDIIHRETFPTIRELRKEGLVE